MASAQMQGQGGDMGESHCLPGVAAPFAGACRWLISLDYDGTLRAEQGEAVPASFLALMARWRPYGVRWGINTGRALPYLLGELLPCLSAQNAALPDFVCTCERYVHQAGDDGRLLPAEAHNARCLADNLALRCACLPAVRAAMERVSRAHPEWQWEYAADDPLSIEAVDSETMDALLPAMLQLAETLPGAAVQRAGRYLRFSDARHNKGTALAFIADSWGVPGARVAIIGDGQNDLDAFRLFPDAYCAAPAGAAPEVVSYLRECGGYVSPRLGVEDALLHWAQQNGLE